jgi:hypothetical protein
MDSMLVDQLYRHRDPLPYSLYDMVYLTSYGQQDQVESIVESWKCEGRIKKAFTICPRL